MLLAWLFPLTGDREVLNSPERLAPEVQQVHLFSNLSPTCLKSSPTFSAEISSLSLVGFESKSKCLWLESDSESEGA